MKKPKIYVLVKNFGGVNHDVDLYESFKGAKKEFRVYTSFRFNRQYTNPESKRYNEKFSETKILELYLPGFLEMRKDGAGHE